MSELITTMLSIPCLSMMGGLSIATHAFNLEQTAFTPRHSFFFSLANIAKEVADKVFCEATVGSRDDKLSDIIRQLIDTPAFRLRVYPDVEIIEMLGALKNVVAMLAGFAEGLKAGFNTRAAVEFDQNR